MVAYKGGLHHPPEFKRDPEPGDLGNRSTRFQLSIRSADTSQPWVHYRVIWIIAVRHGTPANDLFNVHPKLHADGPSLWKPQPPPQAFFAETCVDIKNLDCSLDCNVNVTTLFGFRSGPQSKLASTGFSRFVQRPQHSKPHAWQGRAAQNTNKLCCFPMPTHASRMNSSILIRSDSLKSELSVEQLQAYKCLEHAYDTDHGIPRFRRILQRGVLPACHFRIWGGPWARTCPIEGPSLVRLSMKSPKR